MYACQKLTRISNAERVTKAGPGVWGEGASRVALIGRATERGRWRSSEVARAKERTSG